MRGRELHYVWVWELSAPPERLWPLVADTNRFNRDAGVPPLEGGEVGRAGRRTLRLSRLGVTVEWEEEPFEWVEPRRFAVRRRYTRGPLAAMDVVVELEPRDGGTRATYDIRARPRGLFGGPAARVQIGWLSRRRFERTFRRYDELASTPAAPAEPRPVASLVPGGRERIAAARERLVSTGLDAELVERLSLLVQQADELDAARLRPYALADAWHADRRTVLELFLHATRAGLLELRWDLMCPLCRGAQERSPSLQELSAHGHCESCRVHFDADFERSVEVTFRPSAAIREVEAPNFCVGGPQLTPHVAAQQLLAAGEEREVLLRLPIGRYRLRTRDGGQATELTVTADGPADASLSLAGMRRDLVLGEEAALRVANTTTEEQLVVLERPGWSHQAVTAAEVTALQVFRDLFASEALRPGEPISVGTLTLLFTDLRDSTRFYREVGDAPAFGSVAEHLALVRAIVADEGGAVVKTMGDAIMAVFARPVSAARAALRAQEEAAAPRDGSRPFVLKAGLQTGPCIAVNQNGRLDYFGSTVNIAARLVDLSSGRDVIASGAVVEDPEVAELLARSGAVACEPLEAALRGLEDERLPVWSLSAAAAVSRRAGA